MRKTISILLSVLLIMSCVVLTACGKTEEQSPDSAGSAAVNNYGYDGTEAWEAEIYRYMAEDLAAEHYETGDGIYSVPVIRILDVAETEDGGRDVWGEFDINNYTVNGETFQCVSGGNYPGKMHLAKNGDSFTVTDFTMVADGADFIPSAQEIFGDRYEEFSAMSSDENAREAARKDILVKYVKANGLAVTQYQDYGWDPVPLY